MKRLFGRWRMILSLALALSLLPGVLIVPAAGDATGKKYVSSIRLCVAATWEEAAAYLREAGYEPVAGNLNGGAGDGANAVCLGIRTTDDSRQALTDIAVLTMNSGYVHTDGDAIERLSSASLNEAVTAVQTAARGWRTAYEAGSVPAKAAYEFLMNFRDGETETTLAELLLRDEPESGTETETETGSETGSETESEHAAESKTEDTVRRILTRGNLTVLSAVLSVLYIGNGDPDGRALIRTLTDPTDPAEPQSEDTERVAEAMLQNWDSVREPLRFYRDASVQWDADSAAVTAYMASLNSRELGKYLLGGAYTQAAGETLTELFLRDGLTAAELSPFVARMSEGQRALVPYLAPDLLLFAGFDNVRKQPAGGTTVGGDEEPDTQSDSPEEQPVERTYASVAVCEGILWALYQEGGVALSAKSAEVCARNAEWGWLLGNNPLTEQLESLLDSFCNQLFVETMRIGSGVILPKPEGEKEDADSSGASVRAYLNTAVKERGAEICATAITGKPVYGGLAVSRMSAGAVCAVWELARGADLRYEKLPQYRRIPGTVVTTSDAYNYLYHNAVGQFVLPSATVVNGAGETVPLVGQTGYYGDVNGWSGSQWGVIYASSSIYAGKPIYASDFCILADRESAALTRNVLHEFDLQVPYNIMRDMNSAAPGLYLYFDRMRDEGTLNATVFSRLDLCLAIGGGSVGGIIIGAVAVYVGYETKKRKNEDHNKKEEN